MATNLPADSVAAEKFVAQPTLKLPDPTQPTTASGLKDLVDHVAEMRGLFESMKGDLAYLSASAYGDAGVVQTLETSWVQLSKRFVGWMGVTREVAVKSASYVSDFVQEILPCVDDNKVILSHKSKALVKFMERTKPDIKVEEKSVSDAFSGLLHDVQRMAFLTLKTIIQPDSLMLVSDMMLLKHEVALLKKEHEGLRRKLDRTPLRYGLMAVVAESIGVVVCMTYLSVSYVVLVTVVLGILFHHFTDEHMKESAKRYVEVENCTDAKEQKIGKLLKQSEHIEKLGTAISKAYDLVDVIQCDIRSLIGVWDMVAEEAKRLKNENLTNVVSNDALLHRIGGLRRTYPIIVKELAEYAIATKRY